MDVLEEVLDEEVILKFRSSEYYGANAK
jgi:hypothetical protein